MRFFFTKMFMPVCSLWSPVMRFLFSKIFLIIIFSLTCSSFLYSQKNTLSGTVQGKVIENETKQPIPGVNIVISSTNKGTTSDMDGNYKFENLDVGSYSIVFSFIGYEKIVKTDIIVSPGKITFLNAELRSSSIELNSITVTSHFFDRIENQPLSSTSFSYEEVRRAPGGAGDVSRIIFGLPSLAKINDTKNSLIVRGGSPVENKFYVDNIEIPNINHFPVQGSTEGPIGIINTEFLDNVNFLSGGFSANYSDCMSSVMELKFREGNRIKADAQMEMSMQGFGGIIEGPINNGNGSYMISARRSYLDLLMQISNDKGGIPDYYDIQGKVVYDLSKDQKLSIIDVFSTDHQRTKREDAFDDKENVYPDYKYYSNTAGINIQSLWGSIGYSDLTFSHTYSKTICTFSQSYDGKLLLDNHSKEEEYNIKKTGHLIFTPGFKFDFGLDAKFYLINYRQFYNEYQDLLGKKTEAMTVDRKINSHRLGGYANLILEPVGNFTITPGVRVDHYQYNNATNISPRISTEYKLNDLTSLTGAFGIYYQNIPWVIAAQKNDFRKLKNPKAYHYVLGINHLLTESTKLTLEVYNKEYSDFPMDPDQPNLFVFDQAVLENVFLTHQSLNNNGKAKSKGIELTIQKKLAEDFYGLVSGSISKSKYRDLSGKWYDRVYDNRFNFAVEGGYKMNEKWEFSLRWLYAGGAPYTPFDEKASMEANKGVLDYTKINSARLPDFHSLNLRADRRFNYQSSALIVYLSIWNAYARENVAAYSWNEIDKKIVKETMWGIMPVFGIEYEF